MSRKKVDKKTAINLGLGGGIGILGSFSLIIAAGIFTNQITFWEGFWLAVWILMFPVIVLIILIIIILAIAGGMEVLS